MKFLILFAQFFKIGLFSIGGGLATLPFVFELADRYPWWLDREIIANMLAVAQSLPGAVGVNFASYTGFRYAGLGMTGEMNLVRGIPGGYTAALGLALPSIIIIIVIARTLKAFKESPVVAALFTGFRPAAAGLLSAAGLGAILISLYNPAASSWTGWVRWKETLLFIVLFLLIYKFKKHPIVYFAAAGVAGVALGL